MKQNPVDQYLILADETPLRGIFTKTCFHESLCFHEILLILLYHDRSVTTIAWGSDYNLEGAIMYFK